MPTSILPTIVRDGLEPPALEDGTPNPRAGEPRFKVVDVARERWLGPFADPRPDELEARIAATIDRGEARMRRCLEDEARRVKAGKPLGEARCRPKATRSDDHA